VRGSAGHANTEGKGDGAIDAAVLGDFFGERFMGAEKAAVEQQEPRRANAQNESGVFRRVELALGQSGAPRSGVSGIPNSAVP
jgi:hypothetical protein